MSDEVEGEIAEIKPTNQELMIEMRLKVSAPRMTATRLAEGIKRIILKQWPQCVVMLEDIQMVSVADADLAFKKSQAEEAEEDEG